MIPKVFEAIQSDYMRDWSLDQLANLAGMSRSGFALMFEKKVGVTPMIYLMNWRLQIACELLQGGRRQSRSNRHRHRLWLWLRKRIQRCLHENREVQARSVPQADLLFQAGQGRTKRAPANILSHILQSSRPQPFSTPTVQNHHCSAPSFFLSWRSVHRVRVHLRR